MSCDDYEGVIDAASGTIPFVKYTSCGNNFVIVDATQSSPLAEEGWSEFAGKATSTSFGIGCDNLLVIQTPTFKTMTSIMKARQYWKKLPVIPPADFVFRMFEPNGDEAACCGNGLICVADYLRRTYQITSTTIMTEIPMSQPNAVTIGSDGMDGSWVNLGNPRKMPAKLISTNNLSALSSAIDVINELTINFRATDFQEYIPEGRLTLRGYLVFTGEPHMVIFPDLDFSISGLSDLIFGSTVNGEKPQDSRKGMGGSLVHRIGYYINKRCQNLFPEGISVNFARINHLGMVENRCFERGINRETHACCTGALAVALVAQELFDLDFSSIDLIPMRCQQEAEAGIRIQHTATGWKLTTNPYYLFEGRYSTPPFRINHQHDDDYSQESNFNESVMQTLSLGPPTTSLSWKRFLQNV
ncbi:diaminopimelate epimerase [Hahella sp. CCB-MM4]|uniref:diaminopimelate epimerase n=1 Tax=Hahella sp. (strain CCB-MM4) TaxID=1926491 RepID=UPI000B9B82D7|nr:diaminopimelate epimerase [Hahella sp. CCB-MM4]OZG70717.1 diaminopimelate epimerase [Hahella sp. CCB-MM4]